MWLKDFNPFGNDIKISVINIVFQRNIEFTQNLGVVPEIL